MIDVSPGFANTAIHEAGHAVVALALGIDVVRIDIGVGRGQVATTPDIPLPSMLAMYVAGITAEHVHSGKSCPSLADLDSRREQEELIGGDDMRWAFGAAFCLYGGNRWHHRVPAATKRVYAYLQDNWQAVDRIAQALVLYERTHNQLPATITMPSNVVIQLAQGAGVSHGSGRIQLLPKGRYGLSFPTR